LDFVGCHLISLWLYICSSWVGLHSFHSIITNTITDTQKRQILQFLDHFPLQHQRAPFPAENTQNSFTFVVTLQHQKWLQIYKGMFHLHIETSIMNLKSWSIDLFVFSVVSLVWICDCMLRVWTNLGCMFWRKLFLWF